MKTKSENELLKLLTDTRATLRAERFSAAGSRAKDSDSLRKMRKVIARVHTERHARVQETVASKN